MSTPKPFLRPLSSLTWIAGSCAVLVACGGGSVSLGIGGGTAGVGSGGTGYVTGFGSVIVDGVRYDDSRLDEANRIEIEGPNNTTLIGTRKALGVGQRVELELTGTDVISKIRVESEVLGPVTVTATGNTLEVAGQRVVINTNTANGPTTFLQGFSSIASLTTADRVEVHGVVNGTNANAAIQASRIELQAQRNSAGAAITDIKITGVVGNLASTANGTEFTLGNLTITVPSSVAVSPNAASLRNGAKVKVFAGSSPQNGRLTATAVRVEQFASSVSAYRYSGVVTSVNSGARSFVVDGLQVDASKITAFPNLGQSVRVQGSLNASTQVLTATDLQISDQSGSAIELKGSVSNYVSNSSFSVRNTPVNASGITGLSGLADGAFVELKGRVENGVIQATELEVKSPTAGAELKLGNTISALNTSARTFSLGNQLVSYSTASFDNGSASDLRDGVFVEVEGRLNGNTLQAREIEFRNSNREFELEGVLRDNAVSNGSNLRFTLNGVDLQCTPTTNNSDLSACNVNTLRRGVELEVRYQNSGSVNQVSRIKVDN